MRRLVAGHGLSRPQPLLAAGSQQRCALRVPVRALCMSTGADIDVKEYIKIFGRLGEKMIFGDASAGLCCHSACENCEWRYTFDVMQSGVCSSCPRCMCACVVCLRGCVWGG